MFPPSCALPHLGKVSRQPHLAALTQRAQQACVADEQLDGPLSEGLSALIDEVRTLEVSEVVSHHSRDEALHLLHVEWARNIWLTWAGQRPIKQTNKHTCRLKQLHFIRGYKYWISNNFCLKGTIVEMFYALVLWLLFLKVCKTHDKSSYMLQQSPSLDHTFQCWWVLVVFHVSRNGTSWPVQAQDEQGGRLHRPVRAGL